MIKKILISFISALVVLFWLFQGSINNYWTANYSSPSPLTKLDNIKIWKFGQTINDSILWVKEAMFNAYSTLGQNINDSLNKGLVTPVEQASAHEAEGEENSPPPVANDDFKELIEKQVQENPYSHVLEANKFALGTKDVVAGELDYVTYSFAPEALPIVLRPGDEVLIVGDSLQQAVGRQIRSYLSQNYKITSKDLSKQSTGLLNPNNLNWNETITNELSRANNYKLLIVMLGANDNYGLYDSERKRGYKFGSEAWKAHYLQRIMSIMYQARTHNVSVIWISVPNLRNRDLNDKMHLLNELYSSAAQQYGVLFLDANKPLGLNSTQFEPSLVLNGRMIKTRADDGIHFTIPGARLISNYVLSHVIYEAPMQENNTPEQ